MAEEKAVDEQPFAAAFVGPRYMVIPPPAGTSLSRKSGTSRPSTLLSAFVRSCAAKSPQLLCARFPPAVSSQNLSAATTRAPARGIASCADTTVVATVVFRSALKGFAFSCGTATRKNTGIVGITSALGRSVREEAVAIRSHVPCSRNISTGAPCHLLENLSAMSSRGSPARFSTITSSSLSFLAARTHVDGVYGAHTSSVPPESRSKRFMNSSCLRSE